MTTEVEGDSPAVPGYDCVLLGAGHNALILQAYLGKAGLRTLCLERRNTAGGGLSTVESPSRPGFLHNTHSFYHRGITRMPWYSDLDLERRGAHYIEPDLNVAMLLRDGTALEWWTDFEKTCDSFAKFDRRDANTLRRWRDLFVPIVDEILVPESQSAPLPPASRRTRLEKSERGRLLLEVSKLSPLEFVEGEFQNPVVQAGLLFFNGLREVDLRAVGFGHHIPALIASRGKAQMCRGGSASLARALVDAVQEYGGEIRLETEPARIHVDNGAVAGVETTTGDFIPARCVASGLNPVQTFLHLIEPGLLPEDWRRRAAAYRFNLLAPLFAINVELSAAPEYRAGGRALMVILGLDHSGQFREIVMSHQAGEIPPQRVMWGSCPTAFDASQAPPGAHTAFLWEKVPYRLRGAAANWDREKEVHARRMVDAWCEYAPNLRTNLLGCSAQSPLDTERALPNMTGGDLLVGELALDQTGYERPFEGAGLYRGCFKGLYLCGSSSHPGGNITGLPGYNCAKTLLADLGLKVDR
jgi:phytoene dehydrogenase-like protein